MTLRRSNQPPPTEAERIDHIISHAREAITILGDASLADLERDRVKQLALGYLVAIVGEAANHLSDAILDSLPMNPWDQIIGMRNILIHQYFRVKLDTVHDTVVNDLPVLVASLEAFTDNSQGGQPS